MSEFTGEEMADTLKYISKNHLSLTVYSLGKIEDAAKYISQEHYGILNKFFQGLFIYLFIDIFVIVLFCLFVFVFVLLIDKVKEKRNGTFNPFLK